MADPAAAQANNTVSIAWADELRELGDALARMAPPPAKIDLLVTNMSSLNPDQVAAIDEWLKENLGARHFRVVGTQSADASVNVTLSEGNDSYILVAQIRRGDDEKTAIFPVDKDGEAGKRVGGVVLDDQLIWEQAAAILDFALVQPANPQPPGLIVLEVGRIALYTRNQSQWQLTNSITIPPMRPWLRAPRGSLTVAADLSELTAMLSGVRCEGRFPEGLETIVCGFAPQETPPWAAQDEWKSKHLDSAGDATLTSLVCDGRAVALATGGGDWTQPDSLQAYEIGALKAQGAMASGNPLEMKGPVTALWFTGTNGVVRVVVQNLQTGHYEAHLVTATCSR